MGLGIDPTIPLDSRLHVYGARTGPRGPAGGVGLPGSTFDPVVGTTHLINTTELWEHPATDGVKAPSWFFGTNASSANDGRVAEAEEHGVTLHALCHADAPWGGDDPWLAIADFWLEWVHPEWMKPQEDLAQSSAIAFTEDDVNNSTTAITGTGTGDYGAILGIGNCGRKTGSSPVESIMLFARAESGASGGRLQEVNPGIGAPIGGEIHRWTIVARTRDAAGNPGYVRFYYDQELVWDVPEEGLPKAAMYFHGFVAVGPTSPGGAGNEYGFRLYGLQVYHTRDLTFLPWRAPLRLDLDRTKDGLVLFDTFDRADSNTVGNGWTEAEASATVCRILNNECRIFPGGASAWVFRTEADHPEDFIVQATCRAANSPMNAAIRAMTSGITTSVVQGDDAYTIRLHNGEDDVKLFSRQGGTGSAIASAALTQTPPNQRWQMRMAVWRDSPTSRQMRGYATLGAALKLTPIQRVSATDTRLPAGNQVQLNSGFNNADWDDFFLCGRTLRVRGLREGWKVQLDSGTPVAADASGEVAIDLEGVALPLTAVLVLDENNNRIGGIWPPDGVWGGDEYEVTGILEEAA